MDNFYLVSNRPDLSLTDTEALRLLAFEAASAKSKKAGDIRDLDKNSRLGSFFVLDPCSQIQILQ